MCRIYGFFGTKSISPEVLNNVAREQINGGPDGSKVIVQKNWALGNNRLAIQGLEGGEQPFCANNIYAVYNGEIYNHVALKEKLKKYNYTFNNNCDGSVIIPLYEMYGDNFVSHLDGMFAIAIIDNRSTPKLLLANDPSSIKSIYTHHDKLTDTIYFSSELKSLFMFPIEKQLRLDAINEYLIGRANWHGKTFFEEIVELRPGTLITKRLSYDPKIAHYTSAIFEQYDNKANFETTARDLNTLIDQDMQQMVKADVPICLVTSGGLDSSYLTAIATKYVTNLECFNVAYEGSWPADETPYARELANYYGIKYNQVLIAENEFTHILEKTIQHLGQPNSAPHALSTYALFAAVQQRGFKVAIAGEGADEFFAGYDRFRVAALSEENNWTNQYFDTMCATTQSMRSLVYSKEYQNFLISSDYHLLERAKNKIFEQEKNINSRLKAILLFDQIERFPHYILRRVDHLAMANAVEVRVPFCQPRITSFARSLPDDFLIDSTSVKKILYKAAQDKLPTSIMKRPKQPFTLPIVAMFRKGHALFDLMYDTLNSLRFLCRGFFNQKQITFMINQQMTEPNGRTAEFLWALMILELWLRHINSDLRLEYSGA